METNTPPARRERAGPPERQDPVRPVEADEEAPAASGGRHFKPIYLLIALVALGGLGYGLYAWLTAGQESTDDAQVEADVVPVGPRVPGQVRELTVAENQAVKKGELLFELDPSDYRARASQAEAELAVAQAQAQAAEAQERVVTASATGGLSSAEAAYSGSSVAVANAEAQIEVARAAKVRAEADQRKAELDLGRARQLVEARAVPQRALDDAKSTSEVARAAVRQANAQLSAAEEARRAAVSRVAEAKGKVRASSPVEAQVAAAHAATELARARVKSAESAAKLAELQLSYTRVTAPEDGVVSKLGAQEGQIVQAAQPVAELVPTATYVVANFKETQIGDMHPGQRASITIDAFPGRTFEGRVESRSGGTGARFALIPPDNASGNFVKVVQRVPFRIAWTKPPDVPLAAGLSADVTVHTK